jgi:ribosomal protein S18 acetylase RimI-like enzyme
MSILFPRQNKGAFRWHSVKKRDLPRGQIPQAVETFLRKQERCCVPACACFRRLAKTGHVWYLPDETGNIVSLLMHKRGSLIPVLGENRQVPAPRFLRYFMSLVPIHSVQGLIRDAEIFEGFLIKAGRRPTSRGAYDLMYMDREPQPALLQKGPPGLTLRVPERADIEAMFPLQKAYEEAEVLPPDAVFSPAACRLTLERIVTREHALVACIGSHIVGKVNTNAESFSRSQIGGVYVDDHYRGLGIGAAMIAAFVHDLIAEGKGVSLFVKKQNTAAKALYRRIGFMGAGDYRITYFSRR